MLSRSDGDIRRIDEAGDVTMLWRLYEGVEFEPAEAEEDATRRPAQGGSGRDCGRHELARGHCHVGRVHPQTPTASLDGAVAFPMT